MGNGALPHGPSYRAHPRLYPPCHKRLGRVSPLCPWSSDINLFRYGQGIIDVDAQIPDRAFNLPVAE
jgi:hypothetical protein